MRAGCLNTAVGLLSHLNESQPQMVTAHPLPSNYLPTTRAHPLARFKDGRVYLWQVHDETLTDVTNQVALDLQAPAGSEM